MLDLLADNTEIQTIVNEATRILGNPIVVIDTQFHIAYSSTNVEVNNELWKQTLIEEYVSDELILSMEQSQTIEKLQIETDPIEQDIPDGHKSVRVAIFYHRKYCGFIGIYDYLKPLEEEDKEALRLVSKAIASMLHTDSSMVNDSDNSYENLLHELIVCDNYERAELVSKRNAPVAFNGWKIVVCLGQRGNEKNMPYGRIKELMGQVLYHHYSTIYENRVVIVFCAERINARAIEHTNKILEKYCQKYDLWAGISYEFYQQEFIHYAYLQAVCAYKHGTSNENQRVYKFADSALQSIAVQCTTKYPTAFFQHPAIEKLVLYDEEYNTEYLHTLEEYLCHFCNLKETAGALNIHYNTMKYRMSMIENIIECSLKDDNKLKTVLFFSSVLHHYENERNG